MRSAARQKSLLTRNSYPSIQWGTLIGRGLQKLANYANTAAIIVGGNVRNGDFNSKYSQNNPSRFFNSGVVVRMGYHPLQWNQ